MMTAEKGRILTLPFAPRPCPDEIMSSWLSRIGCRYDCDPWTLLNLLPMGTGQGEDGSACDTIDWGMPRHHQRRVAQAALVKAAVVASCDAAQRLPAVPQYWFAWPTCLDFSAGDAPQAPQFAWVWCPHCLVEGYGDTGQDYLRLAWCHACVSLCPRHQRPFVDYCLCGSHEVPVHIAKGRETRLCCRQCGRHLAGQEVRPTRQEPQRDAEATALQLAFEQNLVAALRGRRVSRRWCGPASPHELLAAVDDIADLLCTEAGARREMPIKAFEIRFHYVPRLGLPDLDHKLCGLSSSWRRPVLGAVLAVIGDAETCAIMSVDRRLAEKPILEWLMEWRGSLEWLLDFVQPAYLDRLSRRVGSWPARLQARFAACAPPPS